MLPPLSTLPEEDPVFRLTPAHSRERYGGTDYSSLSSRSMSRKASVATFTSIFSMRSGSSGNVSHISHSFSRAHSPSVSLSTTLPYSNSQSGSNSGSLVGRRAHGSNAGSVDSGRGPVPSSSMSSLQSKSSMDLRALANARSRQGSQSSGLSLQSRSSTRTKFEPHVQAQARKSPSAEEVSLGLRAYTGNPYAVAVQAELEGKASKYESPSKAKFDDEELVLDISQDAVAPTIESEPEVTGWKTYDSVLEAAGLFEPGTSAGTVRPSTQPTEVEIDTTPSLSVDTEIGADDSSTLNTVRTHTNGYGYSSGRGGSGRDWDGAGGYTGHSSGFGGRYGSSGSDESGGRRGGLNTGRRGRDDSRGGDGERQNRKLPVSAPSSSEEESESESETSSDDYGEETGIVHRPAAPQIPSVRAPSAASNSQEEPVSPIFSQLRNGRKGVFRPPTITTTADTSEQRRPPTAEDDDVPLAQRIPGALHAQQTIRQQVRSERDRRRRDRSVAPTPRTSRAPEGTISPPPQHVPSVNQDDRGRSLIARLPRTAPLGAAAATLSSSQEAAIIAQRMTQPQHVQQIPRRQRAKTLSGADAGIPPEDLMKRLLKVQARDTDAPLPTQRISGSAAGHLQQQSSHVRDATPAEAMSRRKPVPGQDIMLPTAHQTLPNTPGPSAPPAHTLRPMRSLHNLTPVAGAATTSAPMASATVARRPTSSRGRPSQEANTVPDGLMRNKSLRGTRPSIDKTNAEEAEALRSPHPRVQSHHVPPVPAVSRGPSPPARSHRHVVQMRVYIGDMQRFNVVEAGLETSARDVLDMLKQQGDLRGEDRRLNNWMLYEVCHDFGMERPVRSFELVTDISGSWNKEKTMNCFMVKQSPFAHSLATIPSSIPTRSGFVDYESKKGKWNKRWLELREHGLWVSKREGKDDEFLCSLSAFDAYIVTRIHKATKSFTFAVKSTDPITLFENKADYLHVFSVPEDTGMAWVEAIWLARSYILYQEKNVLFRNKMSSEGTSSTLSSSGGLTRSGTRKKPAQTYVTLTQPKVPGVTDVNGPFEPGSLLARRAAT
ncbi:uncharacterized protein FOMMEDRAFT_137219 [Fomitiporia mediterranea MF3/22]|uniref:uncharacterized protein n=1 Tax=Fomitiporia mediterranea (strain MF3/22) TaxID=694068 RepID=UPI0004407A29|nr:uncharacterized protein FOMMEDRAFT_137219 [Fomitiporia mediterranea MF3/22]EJC97816.1 hypothetical protein FOMMEDRAFT_137219 [Fomitiporia mediterranea MF3/22]